MLFAARTSLWPMALLAGLLAGPPAPAATSGVEDGAGFFSADAVRKAREEIKAIKEHSDKDLLIETFRTLPADRKEGQNLQGDARRQFFRKWADDRVKEAKLHGVYVLITRSPGRIEVAVSEDTLKKGFAAADRDRLTKLLAERFKAEDYDAGLLDGVRFVRDTLAKNLPARLPRPVANAVKDYGGFFKPEAVQKATGELEEIHRRTGKNIVLETFKTVPTSDVRRVTDMSLQQRRDYFANWMKNRVQGTPFDVYVLITREPGHFQIAIGPEAEKGAFTAKNRAQLEAVLLGKFKEKEFDQGLADAVAYLRKTLDARSDATTTRPEPATTARTTARSASAPVTTRTTTPATTPAAATARTDSARAAETTRATPATNADTRKAARGAAVGDGGDGSPPSNERGFNPMWILWIALGLLGLWILYGIFRGLTHRPQPGPTGAYPPTGTYPPTGPGYAAGMGQPPAPGQRMAGPGQPVGPHYASGQPIPPPGAPGYAPGYGPGQPVAGYGPGVPYGGGGGRAGGFLTGMLGGMFGAAAGNWVYDTFARGPHSQPTGGGFGTHAYGGEPHQYNNPPPVGGAAGAAAGGFSSSGSDFDASPAQPLETSGADFDADNNQADTGAGGDFGTNDAGSGADFGSGDDAGSGADFGGGDYSGGSDDTSGADFGGDSGGGDFGGGDAGGGGDFGGGGDSGGGDSGGDF